MGCSEIGEAFAVLKSANTEKKKKNQNNSTQILIDSGVVFRSHNNGVHLVVSHGDHVVDFWPSTGKFIFRGGRSGRGVFNLLKFLGVRSI